MMMTTKTNRSRKTGRNSPKSKSGHFLGRKPSAISRNRQGQSNLRVEYPRRQARQAACTDLAANVSKLTGTHDVGVRLELVAV
jgi:hypothetical protein